MPRQLFRLAGLAGAFTALGGCGSEPPEAPRTAKTHQPVVVGADDRLEVGDVDGALQSEVAGRVAALMYAHRIIFLDDGGVQLRAETAADVFDLCESERFREQPSAAFCSGVLIDDDLLLTAGHCLGQNAAQAEERCAQIRIVFGYGLDASGEIRLSADAVFSCKRIALHERAVADYAVIQLDRAATQERTPAVFASRRPTVGDRLVVATHGAGLPLKLELAALVTDAPDGAGTFIAATDTFGGGSGGGLFSADRALAGIVLRGRPDWENVDGCTRAAHVVDASEEHQYVDLARKALCDGGWPSQRLCAVTPRCGDGVCSTTESSDLCGADCSAPRCGDGLCSVDERSACAEDCHRFDDVPINWPSEPSGYLAATDRPRTGTHAMSSCTTSRPSKRGDAPPWLALLVASLCAGTRVARRRGHSHRRPR